MHRSSAGPPDKASQKGKASAVLDTEQTSAKHITMWNKILGGNWSKYKINTNMGESTMPLSLLETPVDQMTFSHLSVTDLGRKRNRQVRKNSYVLSILCITGPLSVSRLSDHRGKERGKKCLLRACYRSDLTFCPHKNLRHSFMFSISQGRIWSSERSCSRSCDFYHSSGLVCKNRLLSSSSFCTAQKRCDVGTPSPVVPKWTLFVPCFIPISKVFSTKSVPFGFSQLFSIQWYKFKKPVWKYWLKQRDGLGGLYLSMISFRIPISPPKITF